MADTNLKKEFSKRDVQRMRNIITGNTGDKTQIQAGYEKDTQKYSEGDVWQEDGRTWTIENGIKQNVTKLDSIRKLANLPLSCPTCGGVMKDDEYNRKMWAIHRKCFNCVVKVESELKRLGEYKHYVAEILNANKNAELNDLEMFLNEWVDENDSFVSESGEVEKWGGGDKKAIHERLKQRIAELRKLDIYN